MATLTINFSIPGPVPANGYQVAYRKAGTGDPYTYITPNPTSSPVVIPNLEDRANYEGYIISDCGYGKSTTVNFLTNNCFCPDTFISSPDNSYCYRTETTAASITSSNACFVAVTNATNYSVYGARVYAQGLSLTDISRDISASIGNVPGSDLDAVLTNDYWKRPMNQAGVWLDSDCNGTVDRLTSGSQATIAWSYFNNGPARQVYIGVGADNQFILQVNGTTIAQTTQAGSVDNFRNWHLIPITLVSGSNLVNVIATGDGTTNDCIAFIVYDATSTQLQTANDITPPTVLFTTQSLRNTRWNIATCPQGFDLDTSGGINNYICRRTITAACE